MHPDQPHPGDLAIPMGLTLDDDTPGSPVLPVSRPEDWRNLHGHTWAIRPGHVLDANHVEVYDLTDLRNHLHGRAVALHRQAVADEQGTASLLRWLHKELNVPRAEDLAPATWLNATPLMRLINQRVDRWHASAFHAPGDPASPRHSGP